MRSGKTTLFGGLYCLFYTVGARTYTVLPPTTLLWGQMLPVFIRLAARSFTVLPPPTLLLRRMLPVFYTVGARSSTVLPAPTLLLGQMLSVSFYTVGGANLYCASPYTAPRENSTCFGAMSVDVLDDPLLCCPPTLCMG